MLRYLYFHVSHVSGTYHVRFNLAIFMFGWFVFVVVVVVYFHVTFRDFDVSILCMLIFWVLDI